MTVVSTKEFNAHQDMYLDMALDEDIFVKRGDLTYLVSIADNGYSSEYDEVLEPDDDFRRAISADEFRKRLSVILDRVDMKYANKCK